MEANARPHRYTAEQRDAALEGRPRRGGTASLPGPCAHGRAATAALRLQPKTAVLRSKLLA